MTLNIMVVARWLMGMGSDFRLTSVLDGAHHPNS